MLFFIAAFLSCTDPGAPGQSLAQDTSSAPEETAAPQEPASEPSQEPSAEPAQEPSEPASEPSQEPGPDPGLIRIDVDGFYPNAVAINAIEGNIYIGSYAMGSIHVKNIFSGLSESSAVFYSHAQPGGIGGMRFNGGFLWACFNPADPASGPAALLQIDPSSGGLLASYPLATGAYCARITNDSSGNIFVSEPRSSHIWRLARNAAAIEPWYEGTAYAPSEGGMGFSGIAMSAEQDAVLAGHLESGDIIRIPFLSDGTAGAPGTDSIDRGITASGIGSMRWHDGNLYAVRDGGFLRLAGEGGSWASDELSLELDTPSALVFFRGGAGELWGVESQLRFLLDGDESTAGAVPFRVVKLPL